MCSAPATDDSTSIPRISSGLTRSWIAASRPAAARCGGWRSTSSVRRSRTLWRRLSIAGRDRGGFVRVAACRGIVGDRRERVGDARDVLHRTVVQVGGEASPLAVRAGDRVCEQRLAVLVAALQSAHQRPDERNLHEHEQRDCAEDRRSELGEEPARAGVDGVEPLVDLEQHGGARWRSDRRVRLDQLALPAVAHVLGPVEVADLDDRAAVAQDVAARRPRARSGRRPGRDRPSRGRGRLVTRS